MGETFNILTSPLSLFQAGAGEISEILIVLLIQVAIILAAAKVAGELASRFLKIPAVLAELGVGVAIGPFALGGLSFYGIGPLFPIPLIDGKPAPIPVGNELYALAQIGSVVLLFAIGLETNLRQFLKYAGPATAVAIGGVVLPFALGAGATVMFGFDGGGGWTSPQALFMGAILTATSVGITARVLADLHRLDDPEGVTIIAAAVVDDVLGIMVLTVVVGISTVDDFTLGTLGWISFKAIGFWLALTVVGILVAPYLEKILEKFSSTSALMCIPLALALLAAGLAELFGLAFIIGAFSIGLALSTTRLGHLVEAAMLGIVDFLVPVFFVVMGMLVDVTSMQSGLVFGLVISLLAIFSKVVGSGGPALVSGFNMRGSTRIGVGMMPRGEVALIIAGIGLSSGIIGQDLFGVSIMMTVITTLIAPTILVPLFRSGGSGVRRIAREEQEQAMAAVEGAED
ncbi:MAG: cation:proton antiporter [Chloroflexota bacterium]|nr:cation:proton antiporter [Chloroflexota bacterium]